jgi:hypothetical protein
MPNVSIVPSIRKALRRITAGDQPPFKAVDVNRFMERINRDLVLTSSLHLSEGVGKFWDYDSESEFEDLGDAELPSGSSPAPPLPTPPVVAPPPPAQRSAPSPASPSAPPHRCKPPWKSLWKGPLPPAKLSSLATLGDFLPPVFAGRRGAAGAEVAVEAPDPYSTSVLLGNRNQRDTVPVKAHQQADSVPGAWPGLRSGPPPPEAASVPGSRRFVKARNESISGSHTPTVPSNLPPPEPPSTPGRRRRLVNATVPLLWG